jgi:serine phosphatase RsbU (regulator of sigma subunit)
MRNRLSSADYDDGDETGAELNVIIPALACQLRVEARRIPLAGAAGGDIHDAQVTPFGARLLIGDVMGTGMPANETGCQVVAAWRELAVAEPNLPGIAVRLHTLIARSAHPERFVTALLVSCGCGGAEIVCCGHPPPLLLRGGTASFVETFPAPPLGLLDLADGWCTKITVPFAAGDAMLAYTDGVSEARDGSGQYFPLADEVTKALQDPGPELGLLDHLMGSLRTHMAGGQADDALMLLASR